MASLMGKETKMGRPIPEAVAVVVAQTIAVVMAVQEP